MSESSNQSLIGVWLGDYFAKSSELSFPSGSVLQIEGDKIVGRVEPAPTVTLTEWQQSQMDDRLVVYTRKEPPEPIRPPLTWNTETPFDTFGPEFVVKAGITLIGGSIAAPTAGALPANANLLRG